MTHPLQDDFAARLVARMTELGLKNPDVAQAVGVVANTVSKWRQRLQKPNDEQMAKLAATLDVSEQWLDYGGSATPPATSTAGSGRLPQKIRERVKEVELELVRMGADDDLVAGFGQSVRANPGFMSLFSGGAPAQLDATGTMQLLEAFAANYINIVRMAMERRTAEPGRE